LPLPNCFLKHGAKVAFCDLHKGDILKAKKRLVKFGEVFAEPADVRKETDIKRFSTEVIKRFRRVDILVITLVYCRGGPVSVITHFQI
jgi:NAD(P)-dependent dehydrogenase (short-subunit alcohol dehydrogenase family)